MKKLNRALAPKVILKGIALLMLVCLATFGVAYFNANPIGGGTSQMPTVTTGNFNPVASIGGRSQEPLLLILVEDIGGSKPPVGEFAICLNSFEAIGGKSTTVEFNTITPFEIGVNKPDGTLAFPLDLTSDIGGKSSDTGLLHLTFIANSIGGRSVPTGGEIEIIS